MCLVCSLYDFDIFCYALLCFGYVWACLLCLAMIFVWFCWDLLCFARCLLGFAILSYVFAMLLQSLCYVLLCFAMFLLYLAVFLRPQILVPTAPTPPTPGHADNVFRNLAVQSGYRHKVTQTRYTKQSMAKHIQNTAKHSKT